MQGKITYSAVKKGSARVWGKFANFNDKNSKSFESKYWWLRCDEEKIKKNLVILCENKASKEAYSTIHLKYNGTCNIQMPENVLS